MNQRARSRQPIGEPKNLRGCFSRRAFLNVKTPANIFRGRRAGAWPVFLLAAIGCALYAGTLTAGFIYDDAAAIVDNASIRRPGDLAGVLRPPRNTPMAGRPVVNLTLAVNHAAGGLDARGYHAFNIAVHLCCSLLLYGIVLRTLTGREGRAMAFAAALLWMLHPLQSECVAYVTQRTGSVMALFFLLTLYCAIRGWSAAAIVACALGMASKESMVTAPLMVVLYDWAYRDEPWRDVLRRRRGLYAGLGATWLVLLALMAGGPRSATVGFGLGVSAWQYGLNQCVAVVGYLRRAVWPGPVILDYGFPRPLTVLDAAPSAVILLALLAGTAWLLLRRPRLGYPAAWFFAILGPTSSIVPIATEVAADRRVYLALAGPVVLAVVAGFAMTRLPGRARTRARFAMVTAAALALGVATWHRTETYRDPVELWERSVRAVPGNHRALTNLATALAARGDVEQAAVRLRQALEIEPASSVAAANLEALLATGAAGGR